MDRHSEALRIPPEWPALLADLRERATRVIVVGASDTGKSTLCWWLAEQLAPAGQTAVVDADPGQSRVGPPTCVGWRMAGSTAEQAYFVGDTTPVRRVAAMLAGTARLARLAEQARARWTMIDTTGWVQGPAAAELKRAKAELLAPCHLVLIADGGAGPLARAWQGCYRVHVHRIAAAGRFMKTRGERARWRQACFEQHLAGATPHWVHLEARALSGMPAPGDDPEQVRGRVAAFTDAEGLVVGLGVLDRIDWSSQRAKVLCHQRALEACGLQIGLARYTQAGLEAGRSSADRHARGVT